MYSSQGNTKTGVPDVTDISDEKTSIHLLLSTPYPSSPNRHPRNVKTICVMTNTHQSITNLLGVEILRVLPVLSVITPSNASHLPAFRGVSNPRPLLPDPWKSARFPTPSSGRGARPTTGETQKNHNKATLASLNSPKGELHGRARVRVHPGDLCAMTLTRDLFGHITCFLTPHVLYTL